MSYHCKDVQQEEESHLVCRSRPVEAKPTCKTMVSSFSILDRGKTRCTLHIDSSNNTEVVLYCAEIVKYCAKTGDQKYICPQLAKLTSNLKSTEIAYYCTGIVHSCAEMVV